MDAYHLTPEKLVGQFKNELHDIQVAVVGFCPRPGILDQYHLRKTEQQFFIHLAPASVEICKFSEHKFLSLCHVYGGPVSAALVEELAFYGINTILAYGLAGGISPQLQMGDYYLVESARVGDGTTPHYTNDIDTFSDPVISNAILALVKQTPLQNIAKVKTFTNDAIYKESETLLSKASQANCDIINCDSSHLFAASKAVGINSIQCGVISDASDQHDWETSLHTMLTTDGEKEKNPIMQLSPLVEFYVECLIPRLDSL